MNRAVIVGAGPGGATLAYLLARRGIDVTLLERQTDFGREFRGEVLLPGGLEPFQQMGLWDELVAVPNVKLDAAELYMTGRRRMCVDLDRAFGDLAPRWVSQPALLEMLVAQAGLHPSFDFERGSSARELLRDGERVVGVRLSTGREIRGALVVGADGRASMVRREAGLEAPRDPVPMDVVWCKLPRPDFMRADLRLRAYLGHGHLLIAAPVYGDRLQVAWIIAKGSIGEIRRRGMPECLSRMADHVSPDLAEHLRRHRDEAVQPFLLSTVSDRVLEWTRPGLMVIGDAAHTMSPVGAQGLNVAIRDAVVAANHLVPVLSGDVTPEAVDAATRRVEGERAPEVSSIQRLQALPPRMFLRNTWWSRLTMRIVPTLLGPAVRLAGGGALLRRAARGVREVRLEV